MEDRKKKDFLDHYNNAHDQFIRYCRAISGNSTAAEDLVQESVLIAFEGFEKIKDKNAFKPFLFSVARNVRKMKMRRLKFRAEFNEQEAHQIIDKTQNQEYLTDFQLIYEKIMQLPPKMSEAIILFHISDLPLEDIQKIQGGSLSAVKLRIKRGREKLISLLNTSDQVKIVQLLFTF